MAGQKATFVVWLWSTKAVSTGVSVKAAVAPAQDVGAPEFSVCPAARGATCTVGNLPGGQADELEVAIKVDASAAPGEHVRLTAKASAAGATSFAASATVLVEASPTRSPATGPSSPTGPPVQLQVPAPLPTLSGTDVFPTDPSGMFPTVGASPTTGTGSLGLPSARPRAVVHARTAAATGPLDARLLSGQLAGLAALAGAVTIAIARLSLRKPKATENAPAKPPEQP